MTFARRCLCAWMLLLPWSSTVFAAPPGASRPSTTSKSSRETARDLAEKGYERFEASDYTGALELFQQAEQLYHAPPHWLYIARSQEKLGKLLKAVEAYERVLADDLDSKAPKPFVDAQSSARTELDALRARIPSVKIEISGAPEGVIPVVKLDDAVLDADKQNKPVPVEPGQHVVRVTAGDLPPVERSVNVEEGKSETVQITLAPKPQPMSLVPVAVAFGAGAAGLILGTVTGVLSLNKVGELKDVCPTKQCSPEQKPLADDAKTLGTLSTFAFVFGGALTGAGVVLLVIRANKMPSMETTNNTALSARVGPGSITLRGSF